MIRSANGVTLIPTPGHEEAAAAVKKLIDDKRRGSEGEIQASIATPTSDPRSNSEIRFRLQKPGIAGEDCYILTSGPGTPEMMWDLLLTIGYTKGRRAGRITLVPGYFPYSRTDKDEGDLEFAIPRLMVDLWETAAGKKGIDRIIVPDPHSLQLVMAAGMGDVTPVTLIRRLFLQALQDARAADYTKICLLFPDDGADKRFARTILTLLEEMNETIPVFMAQKRRLDSHTTVMTGLSPNGADDLAKIKGSLVISIDDELNTGGTNEGTGTQIMADALGAKAYWCLAPHGVFGNSGPTRLARTDSPISRIYVTNTIPLGPRRAHLAPLMDSGKLHVVSWHGDLADMIFFNHHGKDIRMRR